MAHAGINWGQCLLSCTQCHGLTDSPCQSRFHACWVFEKRTLLKLLTLASSFLISNYIGHLCMLICHEEINSIPLWQFKVTRYRSCTYTLQFSFWNSHNQMCFFIQPNIEFSSYLYTVQSAIIIVWYVELKQKTDCFSKTKQKTSLLRNCPSALLFLHPGCLQKQNLAGKFVSFDHACMHDCSIEIPHRFSLSEFVLCFSAHPL